ncbi:MAG TPA: hypothetical protein VFZ40_15025 [Pyrinomonadaceae bacterium]
MYRILLVGVFLFLLATSALAQEASNQNELTEKNWNDLFAALDEDQWVTAADAATKYLKQLKEEDKDHSLARLRYILIFASAGKVTQRQMTYPELDKVLTDLLGKDIMTPFRRIDPCEGGPGRLGALCVRETKASGSATNRAGTYIHAFEYAELEKPFDAGKHKDKYGAVRGLFRGYQLNPNKSTLWIMRLYVEKATLELDQ